MSHPDQPNADLENDQPTAAGNPVVGRTAARGSWLLRFRLSSFLSAMAVVCIGAAWWFRSAPVQYTFSDGVQVYTRLEARENGVDEYTGDFHLVDSRGRVMVRGSHVDGDASGVWTSYYESGYRSATGPVRGGLVFGRWTYWSPNGRRRAEIEYAIPESTVTSPNPLQSPKWRHGKATYWSASNGSKSAEGQFADNRRTGEWSFWNQGGKLIARGNYFQGRRYGAWDVEQEGELRSIYYVADTPIGETKPMRKHVQELARSIEEGVSTWRHDLAELKTHENESLPLLIGALERTPHAAIQSDLLLVLARHGQSAAAAKPRVEALLSSPSQAVRRDAAICLCGIDAASQERALELISENTIGALNLADLPLEGLVDSFDIKLLDRLLDGKGPAVPVRLRRLAGFVVAEALTTVRQRGFTPNAALAKISERAARDSDPVVAAAVRPVSGFQYFSSPTTW